MRSIRFIKPIQPPARFFSSSTTSNFQSKRIGPKTAATFNTTSLVALFLDDSRFTQEEEFLSLKSHMIGFDLNQGQLLNPKCEEGSVVASQELNKQRRIFLAILGLRYPGILMFAQQLYMAREQALLAKKDEARRAYFDYIEEKLGITISEAIRKSLPVNEFASANDQAFIELVAIRVKAYFGETITIGSYEKEELEYHLPKLLEKLLAQKGQTIESTLMKFNMLEYVRDHLLPNKGIAADTESDKTQRLSL